jgi:parallel beta-helix repeat protein
MNRKELLLVALMGTALLMTISAIPVMAVPADDTGFTAKIVATTGQMITGAVNATGYDVGIYVGPSVTGVVIRNAQVFGANDHGIYVKDTSGIVVRDSIISGNGVAPHSGLTEDKAIALAGTIGVLVINNNVSFNLVDGGISIIDDGPNNPAQPNPGSPHVSRGNVIVGNLVMDNVGACGIVVASKNAGEGVSNNVIEGNTVIGNSPPDLPPYIGGIVIAGIRATNNVVIGNVVTGGWLAGISIHSFKPGDVVSGTKVINNRLESNGKGDIATESTGIDIVALGGVVINTLIVHNTVTDDYFGVWHVNDINTRIVQLQGDSVVPIAP